MRSGSLIFLLIISNILVWSSFWGERSSEPLVYFFDVGQGDSGLIRVNGMDILIDAGPGKSVLYGLEQALPKMDKYIDLVVLSHPHADHYGGLDYILSDYEVGAIAWNGSDSSEELNAVIGKAKEKGIPAIRFFAGSAIRSDGLDVKVVYPPREAEDEVLAGNDGSLVLFAEFGEIRGLFAGDIARKAEPLVSAVKFPKLDFFKIPHHGSDTSSSYALISATSPSVAVLSVGKNNYGLPDETALERFASFGIPVFRTDKEKGIKIGLSGGKLIIKSLE